MLFGSWSAFLPGSEAFVFTEAFVSPLWRCVTRGGLQRRKGKVRADVAGQLVPVPAGHLGKPVQGLLVFYGRNRIV